MWCRNGRQPEPRRPAGRHIVNRSPRSTPLLRRLTRAETLRAEPADLDTAFPIRSKLRFRGVGFRRRDGREYYFKTWRIDEVLGALQAAGFPVSTWIIRGGVRGSWSCDFRLS